MVSRSVPLRMSVLALVAVLFAGCMQPAPHTGTSPPASASEKLQYYDHPGLGPILADPDGRVLYVFTNDEPGKSNCYNQCASNWPPYNVDDEPGAPQEIASKLTLVTRTDNATQLAYREMPLYYWAQDEKPGDATGDGVGGVWFVVRKPPANSEMLNGRGDKEIESENVTYFQSTVGYYAAPVGDPSPTGVVMIHEWWGLNDNIRDMADILASNGYAVLAVDLFEGKVATTQQEAQAQVGGLDQAKAIENMQAAADHLRSKGATEIASLGWCFGGGQSLQLAMSGEELVATVIYYGFLTSDESKLGVIEWPVLGIFGEKDQAISVASVRAFEKAMDNVSAENENEIYVYPEVGHAFANPSGDAWAPDETKDAWARTMTFLARHTLAVE